MVGVDAFGIGAGQLGNINALDGSNTPDGVAVDSKGDLFVADTANNRVEEFAYNSATATYAATATEVAGTGGSGTKSNQLEDPGSVALNPEGNLFVADYGNERVMEYTYSSSTGTFSTSGTQIATFPDPTGWLTSDASGDLFVAETTTGVLEYPYSSSGYPSAAVAVPGATQMSSLTVTALAFDSHNDLFAATGGEVLEFAYSPSGGTWAASGTVVATPPAGKLPADYASFITGVAGIALDANGDLFFGDDDISAVVYEAPAGGSTAPTSSSGSSSSSSSSSSTSASNGTANLVPDPNFASSAVPADYWGSTLARESTVVYPGSLWALAQTTTSSSGGWDLDDNPSWYAPVSSANTYSAYVWVEATAAVKVDIGVDLLTASGSYVDTASGPWVTLVPNAWTELPLSGIKPTASEVYAGMEPDFSKATKGTVIYWDNMSLTA